jgi:hypothetical protein
MLKSSDLGEALLSAPVQPKRFPGEFPRDALYGKCRPEALTGSATEVLTGSAGRPAVGLLIAATMTKGVILARFGVVVGVTALEVGAEVARCCRRRWRFPLFSLLRKVTCMDDLGGDFFICSGSSRTVATAACGEAKDGRFSGRLELPFMLGLRVFFTASSNRTLRRVFSSRSPWSSAVWFRALEVASC